MNPKEKAEELVGNFIPLTKATNYKNIDVTPVTKHKAKQCAIICIDEIIKNQPYDMYTVWQCNNIAGYWREVKQEIEKL
jgi:hypothetical protein